MSGTPEHSAEPVPAEFRRQMAIEAELESWEQVGALQPGSARALAQNWSKQLTQFGPDQIPGEVRKFVHGPHASRYRDPTYVPPTTAAAAVLQTLARHEHRLRPGELESLAVRWGRELVGRNPEVVAGEVARRLNDWRYNEHFAEPLTRPKEVDRLAIVLTKEFFNELGWDGCQKAAKEWGRDFANVPDNQLVRTIAHRLRSQFVVTNLGGKGTVLADDPRLQVNVPTSSSQPPPPRDTAGRFATAEPSRRNALS